MVCIISLQENSLGMDGAIFIATAFKENRQLTYIKYVFTNNDNYSTWTVSLSVYVQFQVVESRK